MGLPKRTSRVTLVNGVDYRWTVTRREWFDMDRPVELTFLAHRVVDPDEKPTRRASHPKLKVTFYEKVCDSVTSRLASIFITGGIQRGWDPAGSKDLSIGFHAAAKLICL